MNIYVRPNKVERMNTIIKWIENNTTERTNREKLLDNALDAYLEGIEKQLGLG